YDRFPDWSPDGRRLVFMHVPVASREPQVTLVNRDGSGRRVLTTSAALVDRYDDKLQQLRPSWSPNGRQIAYPGWLDIRLVPSDGGPSWGLALDCGPPGTCSEPVWTPDGKKIVYAQGSIGADQRIGAADAARPYPCEGGRTSPLTPLRVVSILNRSGFSA